MVVPVEPTNPSMTMGMMLQVPNTLNREGLLIPSARALINNELAALLQSSIGPATRDPASDNGDNSNSNNHRLELSEMTSGTIADLAKVQSEYRMEQSQDDEDDDKQKRWYYEPLKPFELPIISKTPHIEPGRVEIRLMSLMDALGKLD